MNDDLALENVEVPDWIISICDNVDIDGNGQIDYNDFLLASVDLSKDSFMNYCKKAYELLFENSDEAGVEV